MENEVGHAELIASFWHGVSFVGRFKDCRRHKTKESSFWLVWEAIGVVWSLFNLYRKSSERAEARIERKLYHEFNRLHVRARLKG